MIYAETYFDKAVDDALDEMSRKEAKAKETRKAIEEAASHYVVSDEEHHESCISLLRDRKDQWMSVMRILTENGYDFEVQNYPMSDVIEIVWSNKR